MMYHAITTATCQPSRIARRVYVLWATRIWHMSLTIGFHQFHPVPVAVIPERATVWYR